MNRLTENTLWTVGTIVGVGLTLWGTVEACEALFPPDTRPYCTIVLSDEVDTRLCPPGFQNGAWITFDSTTNTFKHVTKP